MMGFVIVAGVCARGNSAFPIMMSVGNAVFGLTLAFAMARRTWIDAPVDD